MKMESVAAVQNALPRQRICERDNERPSARSSLSQTDEETKVAIQNDSSIANIEDEHPLKVQFLPEEEAKEAVAEFSSERQGQTNGFTFRDQQDCEENKVDG